MVGRVDETGLVDAINPDDFQPVSHKTAWSHIHHKPRMSRERASAIKF
jgi:hypothetical protein